MLKRSTYISLILFCLAVILLSTGSLRIHEGGHTGVTYSITENGNEYIYSELNFSQSVIFEVDHVNTAY